MRGLLLSGGLEDDKKTNKLSYFCRLDKQYKINF